MSKVNVGDRFILHSQDGHDYTMEIVNIDNSRKQDMKYAVDVYGDHNKLLNGINNEVSFCGDELLNTCERVKE